MTDQEIASLHTVFVIIYLQEIAWISAPLLISGNVFLHALIRKLPPSSLVYSAVTFGFFLLSGISLGVSLILAQTRALSRQRPRFFLPYLITKITRMIVLGAVSAVVLITPNLLMHYFYAAVYGLFECAAGVVAVEVTLRSWRVLAKRDGSCGRRRQSASDAPPTLGLSKQTLVMSACD